MLMLQSSTEVLLRCLLLPPPGMEKHAASDAVGAWPQVVHGMQGRVMQPGRQELTMLPQVHADDITC